MLACNTMTRLDCGKPMVLITVIPHNKDTICLHCYKCVKNEDKITAIRKSWSWSSDKWDRTTSNAELHERVTP